MSRRSIPLEPLGWTVLFTGALVLILGVSAEEPVRRDQSRSTPTSGGGSLCWEAVLERDEGDWVLLELPGGEAWYLRRELLPEGCREGEALCVTLRASPGLTRARREQAERRLAALRGGADGP